MPAYKITDHDPVAHLENYQNKVKYSIRVWKFPKIFDLGIGGFSCSMPRLLITHIAGCTSTSANFITILHKV
ncbi:hypothetical protein CFR74_01645 [Novacetimonas hansenii]|nr:hypothetical protein CFR74_01645 [Novacetimonas hansenii]